MTELSPEDVAKEAAKKAERDKADRETLKAIGRDYENPATLKLYQGLQDKLADGRITHREAEHRLYMQEFESADKERREAAKKERAQEPAREQPKAEKDATAERMAGRGEKEAEASKIDPDRFRSDPDYRREMKERTAEQLKEERQQRGQQQREMERDRER